MIGVRVPEMRVSYIAAILAFAACPNMAAAGAASQEEKAQPAATETAKPAKVRTDTPSGLPVPRFVSLKSSRTYCRTGPTFEHPVKITFMRQGLPVTVIAETRDHWRKIRDSEGDECWIHKAKLSGLKTVMVIEEGLIVRARPNQDAAVRARMGEGLIAKVEKTRAGWVKISTDQLRGWAPASGFWGAG